LKQKIATKFEEKAIRKTERNLQKTSPQNKQILVKTRPKTSKCKSSKKTATAQKNKPKFAGKPQG